MQQEAAQPVTCSLQNALLVWRLQCEWVAADGGCGAEADDYVARAAATSGAAMPVYERTAEAVS